ncbi:nuclear pore complex protein NUP205 isoform X1 [Phoenix dactylifera]|uniref:Nuclear pore complex protein NUP205 isoform X1 n=1 Tax=Phoenix dactylifera TaxID=42345 RepID=A0A8B8IZV8_PHODC|nr:nuclear pore complex protein NUP205 isoform X1 [Phoenix dactylifera]
MVSPHQLLSTIEAALLGPSPPTATQRIELMHAIRSSLPALRTLLSYPSPKASDRSQVQSKEIRLPDSSPITLDDMDVQIALKLSDDLNLNEIECVRLLVSANKEWVLLGREPLEIFRLAAGLWYMERRDFITSLYTLLRAVVLDQGLDADLVADIQKHLEDLFISGLRQRLIMLIKELNREEPAGFGGPNSECYVLDFRGAIVQRRAVVSRERLSLSHCLVLSVLVTRMSPKDVKNVFETLKDCAAEVDTDATVQLQITFSLLFSLVIAFMSDALSTIPNKASTLSLDASFRYEFHELVMTTGNNPNVEGFVDGVRLAWTVYLMLTQDQSTSRDTISGVPSKDMTNIYSCLELVCSNNVFHFFLARVLQAAAYQNDDEDMVYMYNGYMHKLMMCFLSNPLSRDKVKEMKEKAMSALSPYILLGSDDFRGDTFSDPRQVTQMSCQPFVSLLELVREIYQKEPELLYGNEELWTFINFAGEDHTNIRTLVSFLRLLSTLASNEEGASKVFELLQGKMFRSIGWSTLFDCLSIYEDKFKQSLQTSGTMLPEFQEGDAQALVAYLDVLKKVVENGNPIERKKWFPDIEPLFKLLSYENVPPYLKGALRNAITAFIKVSPVLKDAIWNYLEQYDLPVVVGPSVGSGGKHVATQVYDMRFELNEVEARRERYPSTISFLNLLNALIAEERDVSDRGRRFVGIFRFVYDHVFGPFPQRAYGDLSEKWQLVLACLQHFRMVLSMYDIKDEDISSAVDMSQPSAMAHISPLENQLPVLELLKDFMSGKIVFRNIMSIILLGVNTIINERSTQTYGQLLEKAVHLSLEIIILVMERDLFLADFWRPLYQPLDIILCQDHNQIVALLEYVRYDFLPQIQHCSIKIMSILSSRMVGLVQLLLKSSAAKCLIEDFATCLELRFDEYQVIENTKDDAGILILQLLIDNIGRPAPNITHLLLRFDVDSPVEQTILQPKVHYSCLKVILDNLEKLSKPDINALLHEFGFQLLYELCLDPLSSGPVMDLLSTKKYQFFSKHLETIGVAPLPKRSNNQALRISSLHQRAWLLKLLALELHLADMAVSTHRETCLAILSQIFVLCSDEIFGNPNGFQTNDADANHAGNRTFNKRKALELLEIVQFRSPDRAMKYSQFLSSLKYDTQVEDILRNSATSEMGGVYYYSERGDRLIDLDAFHDKLWQTFTQVGSHFNEAEKGELRESIQQLLRWGWRHNKNLEEQAAQLHMLTGWSQIVEVPISRRMSLLEDRSQILFELLGASLSASASPDCSLKMAVILSHVALTCMAKLRDERFLCPGGVDSDDVTCLDIISVKQLSNGACHSILFKLMMAILRNESSEALRRRQYALLLSYFQYCRSIIDPDVPASVLHFLLHEEQDGDEELNLQKIDKEQAELERVNFSIIKKEAEAIIDLVTKDARQGSEAGKAISFYVLDAFISIDQEKFFLNQLQSRGILRSCFMEISNFSCKDGGCSLESLQCLCTLEAQISLLLRISHNYGKHGAQILLSMGALEHLASCRAMSLPTKASSRWAGSNIGRDRAGEADKQRLIVTPILRLVSSLTSLVDSSEFLEVKNKIVREVIDFVKAHQSIFDQILREDVTGADELTLERINLVVSILCKVWPYEENDEYGFVQELFAMMHFLFRVDGMSSSFIHSSESIESLKKIELVIFKLCFSLSSYFYFLITKKLIWLQVSDGPGDPSEPGQQQQPTLNLLLDLLSLVTTALERAGEEKFLLLNKIQDINELSRQDVDEIINVCMRQDCISSYDNIRKRRYIAMLEMCHMAGNRDQLIALLLRLAERVMNTLLIHFQDDSNTDSRELSLLCGNLHAVLERIEQLREEKIGHGLKSFQRLVSTLKEMSIRKMAL